MIFIFPISDLLPVACIILMVGEFSEMRHPDAPFELVAIFIGLPGLYVYWRFQRPIEWTARALKSSAVFIYMLIAGKDYEDHELY